MNSVRNLSLVAMLVATSAPAVSAYQVQVQVKDGDNDSILQTNPTKQTSFSFYVSGDTSGCMAIFEDVDPPVEVTSTEIEYDDIANATRITWFGSFPQGTKPHFGFQGCLSSNWDRVGAAYGGVQGPIDVPFLSDARAFVSPDAITVALVNSSGAPVRVVTGGYLGSPTHFDLPELGEDTLPQAMFDVFATDTVIPTGEVRRFSVCSGGGCTAYPFGALYLELEWSDPSPYTGTVQSWMGLSSQASVPTAPPWALGLLLVGLLAAGSLIVWRRARLEPATGGAGTSLTL